MNLNASYLAGIDRRVLCGSQALDFKNIFYLDDPQLLRQQLRVSESVQSMFDFAASSATFKVQNAPVCLTSIRSYSCNMQ